MMYRAFRDSVLGASIFGDAEPRYFRRLALVPCRHRFRRLRGHPTKHHEVIETYHATKQLRVALWSGEKLAEGSVEGVDLANGESMTFSWTADGRFRIDDAPAGAGDDVEAYRG